MPLCEHTFWQYACRVYQQGTMQSALLNLQNEYHKNINLCLLLMQLDHLNLQLSSDDVIQLSTLCQSLDAQLLTPHRQIRSILKQNYQQHPSYAQLRKQLLHSELELEKLQQAELVKRVNQLKPTPQTAPNNLALYLTKTQINTLK